MNLTASAVAGTKPRILIVDDAPTSRLWLEMLLQDRFHLHIAADGIEGIARAAELRPDLILLDVVMPKLDGFAACRILREQPETAATPIIMVTSQADEFDVEQGFRSGCTDYILKPADRHELIAKITGWLAAAEGAGA